MLQNNIKAIKYNLTKCCCYYYVDLESKRAIFTNATSMQKHASGLSRQGKIMSKLFGQRLSGSKKRWYPIQENNPQSQVNTLFKASNLGRSSAGSGKNTTRRMAVLNKLFMEHISDLLATGEASESIVGRGLQITRVRIATDFASINVYWMGGFNDIKQDAELEKELQHCSGKLRHELSQLRLVGEVPRIYFVRERSLSNLTQVEALLKTIDFGVHEEDEVNQPTVGELLEKQRITALKEEFFGNKKYAMKESNSAFSKEDKSVKEVSALKLPEMRHDVFGLDHRDIMSKILTKMRKSKQAWDTHNQISDNTIGTLTMTSLERIRQTLDETSNNAEQFEKFLAKRRERKSVPDRKKYFKDDHLPANELTAMNAIEELDLADLSAEQQKLLNAEDYIHDDDEHFGESKK